MDFIKSHPFLATYLQYTANTESPRIFHVWAALSGISAALGRRCWYPFMNGQVYPNLYIALTGPPAVRKSTSMKIIMKLLEENTGVRFAPDDTGGQRQGLIAALTSMTGDGKEADELTKAMSQFNKAVEFDTFEDVSAKALEKLGEIEVDLRDPRTLYIHATEMNSVLGENNTQLLTFLQKMYDGDRYSYMLKKTAINLSNALLGMLAATTPTQIALALPAEAIGQGFMSRCIFVFADVKHQRKIPRPSLDISVETELGERLRKIFDEFNGAFAEDNAAASRLDEIYVRGIAIPDPRFVHYTERRHGNMQKISMALAAARGDMLIRVQDVDLADQILMFTEQSMPDALGEYGMNKLSVAKQKLVEFTRALIDPMPLGAVYGFMQKDMSKIEFDRSISELHNAKKLAMIEIKGKGPHITGMSEDGARAARKDLHEIANLLRAVR